MTSRGFGPASSSACCCSKSAFARLLTTSGGCNCDTIESRDPGRGVAADPGDLGANGDFGDGDLMSVRSVFSGEFTGAGVDSAGVAAGDPRRGCFEGGGSSEGARGVAALLATGLALGVGSGSGSGVTSISGISDLRVAGLRLVARGALAFGAAVVAGASGSPPPPDLTRLPRGFGAAEEDGPPGVAVIRRDFRRGVGAGSSSNSSSSSSFTSSASEPEDSTTFRREAAARREGRAGVIVDMESTELNWRFVVGDLGGSEALDSLVRGVGYMRALQLLCFLRRGSRIHTKTLAVLASTGAAARYYMYPHAESPTTVLGII